MLLGLFGWLYTQTMPPGISSWIVEGWDSAVLQITGSTWGVPHSPGYPLYTILSNIFVRVVGVLPGLMDTPVVWRVSLWSTVTSLLTLVFLFLAVRRLTRNRIIAATAAAILGLSFNFWRAAIMAEVYSMNALIFALTYWLALVWDDQRRDRWLVLLGLVLGAGVVHHRTAFILPPTIALWVTIRREKPKETQAADADSPLPRWKIVARRWAILVGCSLIPLTSYLYLPWAAENSAGQTWLYANTADWNTFWFVALTREWWGLVQMPGGPAEWLDALAGVFRQQAAEITAAGVVLGLAGLLLSRRHLWLFGPPLLAFTFFGAAYQVADLESMLIPLTLTLVIGIGVLAGVLVRASVRRLITLIRVKDKDLRGNKWLSTAIRVTLSLLLVGLAYFVYRPLAQANYARVDLSGDWQAVDLVEEVAAIAQAGTPLTIIGQDNSVLPDFIYAAVVLGHPVEPLSTTTLSRMPESDSINLLQERLAQQRRVLIDIESLDLGFIPWLNQAIDNGQIFLAPTGHPYLWELLPRPMNNVLPETEPWTVTPAGQFVDGKVSMIAYSQRLVRKRTGCFLRLTLFWRAETPLGEDFYVSVQPLGGETVLDKNDHLALMRGYLPFSALEPGEIVRDEVDMLVRQPAALPGINLVVNLYQVQGDQFPTFGQITLPVAVDPAECSAAG
ncbi:MAG: hypothetical protein Kow0031_01070 [Anaerolineae bacterium]